MTMKNQVSTMIATALLLLPSIASACPVCAQDSSNTTLKVVGCFMTVPFIVAFVVFRVMRKVERIG